MEVLAELERSFRVTGDQRKLEFSEFAGIAERVLCVANFEDSDGLGGVHALSVMDARGLDYDVVFLVGLDDGTFPHYRSEDPLLPDGLRVELNRVLAAILRRRFAGRFPQGLGKLLRTSSDRNSEDSFLFFLALSMTNSRLVISYPAKDESGNPTAISPLLSSLQSVFEGEDSLVVRKSNRDLDAKDCFVKSEFLEFAAASPTRAGEPGEAELLTRSILRRIEVERDREAYLALPTREARAELGEDPRKSSIANVYTGRVGAVERESDPCTGRDRTRRFGAGMERHATERNGGVRL